MQNPTDNWQCEWITFCVMWNVSDMTYACRMVNHWSSAITNQNKERDRVVFSVSFISGKVRFANSQTYALRTYCNGNIMSLAHKRPVRQNMILYRDVIIVSGEDLFCRPILYKVASYSIKNTPSHEIVSIGNGLSGNICVNIVCMWIKTFI